MAPPLNPILDGRLAVRSKDVLVLLVLVLLLGPGGNNLAQLLSNWNDWDWTKNFHYDVIFVDDVIIFPWWRHQNLAKMGPKRKRSWYFNQMCYKVGWPLIWKVIWCSKSKKGQKLPSWQQFLLTSAHFRAFSAVLAPKPRNRVWPHKMTSSHRIFEKFSENVYLMNIELQWKNRLIWVIFRKYMALFVF